MHPSSPSGGGPAARSVRPAAPRRWLLWLAWGAYCLILLAIAEGGAWLLRPAIEQRYPNGAAILRSWEDPAAGLLSQTNVRPHPYLLYETAPNWQKGENRHNAQGYRGAADYGPKPPGVVRVLALGGSTTYGWGVPNPRDSWPAQLEAMLNAAGDGRRYEVVNAGLPYGTSAELLARYMFRDQWLEPDIVIFHEGGNDVMPLMFPNYDPEYRHVRAHGNVPQRRLNEQALIKSNLLRVLYTVWLNRYVTTVYQAEPAGGLAALDRAETLQRVQATEPVGFARNVETLVAYMARQGTRTILMPFASNPEVSKRRPDLVGLEQAHDLALAKNIAVLRDLAARYDLPFVALDEPALRPYFIDNCHLTAEGERIKAQTLLPVVQKTASTISTAD